MSGARRGRLIAFEGAEGVGKSTQLRLLCERLEAAGVPYLGVREPGQTSLGNEIRRIVLDSDHPIVASAEALLFMAARAQLVAQDMRPALEAGDVVLADRFFLSTYAYQAAGRGLPLADVAAANRLATGGLVPDLTLLFDLPEGEGLRRTDRRGKRDRIERAEDDFHRTVIAAFREFADPAWQEAHPEAGPIVRIDATGSEADVAGRVGLVLAGRWPETFASIVGSH
ncbi:MAG: dTMP kinase [Gemmatimonadaceae bacterium]